MKVNIVIDDKNSWVFKRAGAIVGAIKKAGHDCALRLNHKDVAAGSDITFFLSCRGYITPETRRKSKHNIVIHGSNLPKGRGLSPVTWQILAGKKIIPVTLFEVAEKMDAGPYYLKDSIKLDGTELFNDWKDKELACAERMILDFLKKSDKLKPVSQKGCPTFYRKRTPLDSELDINIPVKAQMNLFRIVDNEKYPVFFMHKNKKYILKIYKE